MKYEVTVGTYVAMAVLLTYGLLLGAAETKYGLIYDWIFFTLLLGFLYTTYDTFNQTRWSYALLCAGILLHTLGAVFLYGVRIGWLQYDMLMHFASGFILFFFARHLVYDDTTVADLPAYGVTVILVVMGIAAVHEIIEFVSYGLARGGPGLFTAGGDMVMEYNDLNLDLLFGFGGAMVALLTNAVYDLLRM